MAEPMDDRTKCKACGGELTLDASQACHDITLIDVVIECKGCGQILNAFVDMDEMDVIPGVVPEAEEKTS